MVVKTHIVSAARKLGYKSAAVLNKLGAKKAKLSDGGASPALGDEEA